MSDPLQIDSVALGLYLLNSPGIPSNQYMADLNAIKATGANAVTLEWAVGVKADGSVAIDSSDPSNSQLATITQYAQSLGLTVLWKPHISNYGSSNNLNQFNTNWTTFPYSNFFSGYTQYMSALGQAAQQNNIYAVFLGTENSGLDSSNLSSWSSVISAMRSVYSGKLTYDALYFDSASGNLNANNVVFTKLLDFLSLSYYPSLSSDPNSTAANAQTSFISSSFGTVVSPFAFAYALYLEYGIPIFFGEAGTNHNVLGMTPLPSMSLYSDLNASGQQNTTVQNNYDLALLQFWATHSANWMLGMNLQGVDISSGVKGFAGYSYLTQGDEILGYPIQQVLTNYFVQNTIQPSQILLSSEYYDITVGVNHGASFATQPFQLVTDSKIEALNNALPMPTTSTVQLWVSTSYYQNWVPTKDSGNWATFDVLLNGKVVQSNIAATVSASDTGAPNAVINIAANLIKNGDVLSIVTHLNKLATANEIETLAISNIAIDGLVLNANSAVDPTQHVLLSTGAVGVNSVYGDGDVLSYTISGLSAIQSASSQVRAITGSSASNTVIYPDNYANYSITTSSGGYLVHDNKSFLGSDFLTNIQRLQFNDGTNLALDIGPTQTAGSVYMLYQAAFNRSPDMGGLGYWINAVDNGANITTTVAQAFVNSAEFIAQYGTNPSNASYVDNLYQNVLHRSGDAGGVAYWNQQLNTGAVTKAYVLEQFATLPEGAANVAPTIAHGIAYQQWVG